MTEAMGQPQTELKARQQTKKSTEPDRKITITIVRIIVIVVIMIIIIIITIMI